MTPIRIDLPAGAEIANYIYPEMDLDDLDQDLLTVRLPNNYFIDVGWYPENAPNGHYLIRLFEGTWDNQKLDSPIMTRDVSQVVYYVQKLADRFSRPQIAMSQSSACRTSSMLPASLLVS
jgi:hypothetical protein